MPSRAKVIALIIGAFGSPHPLAFSRVLYVSAETYTALGYGDIVPHGPLRLLAGTEALTGLLMLGWSTSHVVLTMERFWDSPAKDAASGRPHAGGRGRQAARADLRPLQRRPVRPPRDPARTPAR